MRKVVAGLFITLDGVVEAPEKWQLVESRRFDTGVVSLTYTSAWTQAGPRG